MGLNDEREKLRQAAEWVENCELGSQHFTAAFDHAEHVWTTTEDPELHVQAFKVIDKALERIGI